MDQSFKSVNSNRNIIEFTYFLILLTTLIALSSILSVFTMVYCCLKRRNSFKSASDLAQARKIQEICIIPVTKPTLNESKPQLSIDSAKTKSTKSLIERRGSNNSLTINLESSKKKLALMTTSTSESLSTSESSIISISNLLNANEVIKMSKENAFLFKEFYDIPLNQVDTICVSGSGIKNRYKAIIPNELTRVRLPLRNKDPLSSYINANYISGYNNEQKSFIATQGPMSNTLNDFWCMIWNEGVRSVIMITRLKEKNKTKCEMYIPENCDECVMYGDISVTVVNITYKPDYEIRQLNVTYYSETRVLYHYWYTTWPDHNVPDNPDALIQLIKQVDINRKLNNRNNNFYNNDNNYQNINNNNSNNKTPILVHCSAGIGRTGCYIAASIGIEQIDNENMIDLVKIVNRMRQQRGGMIQTLEQYEFVYQVIAYYCVFYKKIIPESPKSPSSTCLQSFTFNTQTIQ